MHFLPFKIHKNFNSCNKITKIFAISINPYHCTSDNISLLISTQDMCTDASKIGYGRCYLNRK